MNLLNHYLLLLCSASNAGMGCTPEYRNISNKLPEPWNKMNAEERKIAQDFFNELFSKYVWGT